MWQTAVTDALSGWLTTTEPLNVVAEDASL
jgi:hypothetical protein